MIAELNHRLSFLLDERRRVCGIAKAEVQSRMIQRGVAHSSGAMLAKEQLAREQVDEALLELFNDVGIAEQAGVPRAQLRPALAEAITRLLMIMRDVFTEKPNAAFKGPAYGVREEHFVELEARAGSLVRQFWAGFLTRSTPQGTQFTLHVHDSPGSAIQQGGVGNVQMKAPLDLHGLRHSLGIAEEAVGSAADTPAKAEVLADLGHLKLELTRQEPHRGMLREIGKSIRSVCESAAGKALGDAAGAAIKDVWEHLEHP